MRVRIPKIRKTRLRGDHQHSFGGDSTPKKDSINHYHVFPKKKKKGEDHLLVRLRPAPRVELRILPS